VRTILAALAVLALAQPALAQDKNPAQGQSSMTRSPALNPTNGPDAQATPSPSAEANQAGDKNPAAGSAAGCGTTTDKLEQTPVYSTPCPEAGKDPTPGSSVRK